MFDFGAYLVWLYPGTNMGLAPPWQRRAARAAGQHNTGTVTTVTAPRQSECHGESPTPSRRGLQRRAVRLRHVCHNSRSDCRSGYYVIFECRIERSAKARTSAPAG